MHSLPKLKVQIDALFIGKVEQLWDNKPPSAIAKQQTAEPLELALDGFVKDNQADLTVHGGPEKALHHYSADHMAHWRSQFPDQADQFVPGCFGENISTSGLNEDDLCLGDILTLGTATVQICQGRQPCWKLNARVHNDEMGYHFQRSGRCGWYYRVIEPGMVQQGDWIELIDRPHLDWTLARLISERFNPRIESKTAEELTTISALSHSWREHFQKRV